MGACLAAGPLRAGKGRCPVRSLLSVVDRLFLVAAMPAVGVLVVALLRMGRPRLWPYLAWAFAAGVWGVWVIVAPQMLVAFALGLVVGWLTVGRVRQQVLEVRRRAAGALVRWATQLEPDRPWSRSV